MERFSRIQNAVKKVMKNVPKNSKLEGVQHLIDRQQDFRTYKKNPARVNDKFMIQRILGHK